MTDNQLNGTNKNVLVSVCIATYKREALLENLLLSLTKQVLAAEIILEIIVTDNDIEATAKTILEKFSDTKKIHFKYFVQPEKNISLTRNLCVENSSGDYICFIDDDEIASELWVQNLYDAMIKYNADGVFGYTEPVFDNNIPLHFRRREFYFTPVEETGAEASFYFTTNAIVKSEIIKNEKVPFDPGYGLTGGEDVHLFERLERKGARFIVSREAVSYEYIPVERGTRQYLFNRALRGGQAFARRKLENNFKYLNKVSIFNKAVIVILISSIQYVAAFYSNNVKIKTTQKLGASIGKIRSVFKVYKKMH